MIIEFGTGQIPEEVISENKQYAGMDNPLWGYDFHSYIVSEKADENGMCRVYKKRDTLFRVSLEDFKNNPVYLITYTKALEMSKQNDPTLEFSTTTASMVFRNMFAEIKRCVEDEEEDEKD